MDEQIIKFEHSQIRKWIPESVERDSMQDMSSDAFIDVSVDDLCKKAYQDGYAAAQNDLREEIQAQAQNTIDNAQEDRRQLCQEIIAIRQEVATVMERELVDFCFSVVKHICHKLFLEDDEVICNMIKYALNLMPIGGSKLTIHVSEQTYQRVVNYFHTDEDDSRNLNFIIDNSLAVGDFYIDSSLASVEGILDDRLKKLQNGL